MIKDEKSNFFIYKKRRKYSKHAYTCKCMSFSDLEKRNLFYHL